MSHRYGFGVYVHWPFCTRICPYCDFNVYRTRNEDRAGLIAAIGADLRGHAERFPLAKAQTVFLGGGTPSLLSGAEVAALLAAVDAAVGIATDAEITLEANPEHGARFADQAAAGVTRFSVGGQALRADALAALGRTHAPGDVRSAVAAASRTGARVSLDMIYAREGQSVAAWREELGEALDLPIGHVSLYQLTIEEGTAFERAVRRGRLKPPGSDLAADLFEATQEMCDAAGIPAYEVSNHARSEADRSRHNQIYWRAGDWLGVGPGAHGRITASGQRLATLAARRPDDYFRAVARSGVGWEAEPTSLTGSQQADEMVLMGLRLDEGVALARIEAVRGRSVPQKVLAELAADGFLCVSDGRARLTAAGVLVADRIAALMLD